MSSLDRIAKQHFLAAARALLHHVVAVETTAAGLTKPRALAAAIARPVGG